MRTRIIYLSFTVLAIIICHPILLLAGPGGPGGPPTPVPFDGGLSLIIIAGAGYAAKKKYDQRKKQKAKQQSTEK